MTVPQDVSAFSITRRLWSFGKGKSTKILDDSGKRDCLGFFMTASGFADEQLLNTDEPIDIIRKKEWLTKLISWSGSSCRQSLTCEQIIRVNDNSNLTGEEREAKLVQLFRSIDVALTFVD